MDGPVYIQSLLLLAERRSTTSRVFTFLLRIRAELHRWLGILTAALHGIIGVSGNVNTSISIIHIAGTVFLS